MAEHVRLERERRGWSTSELAKRVTDAGCPISQSAIWRIESGEPRRKISVDELIAFGRVFNMTVSDLLEPHIEDLPVKELAALIHDWLNLQEEIVFAQEEINYNQASINEIFERMAVRIQDNPELESAAEELLRRKAVDHEALEHVTGKLLEQFRQSVLRLTRRGPTPQAVVISGLRRGLSHPEVLKEAERVGCLPQVQKILEEGTVVTVDTETGRIERASIERFKPGTEGKE